MCSWLQLKWLKEKNFEVRSILFDSIQLKLKGRKKVSSIFATHRNFDELVKTIFIDWFCFHKKRMIWREHGKLSLHKSVCHFVQFYSDMFSRRILDSVQLERIRLDFCVHKSNMKYARRLLKYSHISSTKHSIHVTWSQSMWVWVLRSTFFG